MRGTDLVYFLRRKIERKNEEKKPSTRLDKNPLTIDYDILALPLYCVTTLVLFRISKALLILGASALDQAAPF